MLVEHGHVARVEPSVGVDGGGGGLGVVEVALHDHRAPDPELAALADTPVLAGLGIDDAALDVGDRDTARARVIRPLHGARG